MRTRPRVGGAGKVGSRSELRWINQQAPRSGTGRAQGGKAGQERQGSQVSHLQQDGAGQAGHQWG